MPGGCGARRGEETMICEIRAENSAASGSARLACNSGAFAAGTPLAASCRLRKPRHRACCCRSDTASRPFPALSGLRFFLASYALALPLRAVIFRASAFARRISSAPAVLAIPGFFLLSAIDRRLMRTVLDSDRPRSTAAASSGARPLPAHLPRLLPRLPTLRALRAGPVPSRACFDSHLHLTACPSPLRHPGRWLVELRNYPAWSLSVEAFFYVLFPLLASGDVSPAMGLADGAGRGLDCRIDSTARDARYNSIRLAAVIAAAASPQFASA